MFNLLDLLDCEDALYNLKLFQIVCYAQLQEDLNFTTDQFKRLATEIHPFMIQVAVQQLACNPEILDRCKVSPDFSFPSTIDELRARIIEANNATPEPTTISCIPDVEVSSPEVTACLDTEPAPVLSNIEQLNDDDFLIYAMEHVSDDEQRLMPITTPRATKKKMRDLQRAIVHNKDGRTTTLESRKLKYQTVDFEAGKDRKKYFSPNSSQLRKAPDLEYDVNLLSRFIFPELVVYAPPCSGKSKFNQSGEYYDTDYLPCWNTILPDKVITSIHDLIPRAKKSLAIIPSEDVFRARCEARGLEVGPTWYDDMVRNASQATLVIHSDEYLDDIMFTSEVARRLLE